METHHSFVQLYANSPNCMCFSTIFVGPPTTVNNDVPAPQQKHEKTLNFCAHEAELQQTVSVFPRFYVGPSTTVNNDVIASNIKHEKTLCSKIFALIPNIIACVFLMFYVRLQTTVNNGVRAPRRKREKTLHIPSDLAANWYRWTCFCEVLRRAAEHRK